MKRAAALLMGSLALSAFAGPSDEDVVKAMKKEQAERAARVAALKLTLETLDRYIQYRRESDAATHAVTDAVVQQAQDGKKAQGGAAPVTLNLKQLQQRDEALRAKHGLTGVDFQTLDRMVRDISEARFKSESAATKAAIQAIRAKADGPEGPERDMSRQLIAYWEKNQQVDPNLTKERGEYGSANVDLVLQREKELKEIWARKDAAAARAFGALPGAAAAPPPKP
jgi:hypothetical protein